MWFFENTDIFLCNHNSGVQNTDTALCPHAHVLDGPHNVFYSCSSLWVQSVQEHVLPLEGMFAFEPGTAFFSLAFFPLLCKGSGRRWRAALTLALLAFSSLGAGFALGQNTPGGLCPGPPSGGVPEALCTAPGAHPMPSRLRPCPVSPAPALVGPAEKLLAVAQPPAPGTPVLKGSADLLSQGRAFREAVSY